MPLAKILAQGYPGTAKTGSLAACLDAGYRVVLCDFDGNPEALQFNTKRPDLLTVVPFGDEMRVDSEGKPERTGASACRKFTRFLYNGLPETGKPREWGADTILVLDSLSSFADCAERLALELNRGVTRDGAHIGVLGSEIETALGLLMGKQLNCHRMVISHLKLIAPKAESSYSGETDLQKQIKREIGALQETAFFPNMPGNQVARSLARFFNTALLYETDDRGRRVIRTQPVQGYTVKCPVAVADKIPAESGLATILAAFKASPQATEEVGTVAPAVASPVAPPDDDDSVNALLGMDKGLSFPLGRRR